MCAVSPACKVTLVPTGTTEASTSRPRVTDSLVFISISVCRNSSGLRPGAGQRADALDHREEAVLAGRAEGFVEAELAQGGFGVRLQDFVRRASVEDQLQHGNEAADDERIAVRSEAKRTGVIRIRLHHHPHHRLAAVD